MVIATSQAVQTDSTPASAPDLDVLRARITGDVLVAGEAYDEARKTHDITHDRYPHAIVRAASAQDVAEAVRFARVYGRPFAVRSGGHSVGGHSRRRRRRRHRPVADEGRQHRPGAADGPRPAGRHLRRPRRPAHAYGLALSTGDTSSVGMGGLTTGGGIGWMARKYGLAIDNLLSAQVVTADGEIVTASADEQPGPLLGDPRRRRQLRHRHRVRVPARAGRAGPRRRARSCPPRARCCAAYLDYAADAPDELTTIVERHARAARAVHPADTASASWSSSSSRAGPATSRKASAFSPRCARSAEAVADTDRARCPYPVIYNYTEPAAAPHGAAVRSMFANAHSDATLDAVARGHGAGDVAGQHGAVPRHGRRVVPRRQRRDGLRAPRQALLHHGHRPLARCGRGPRTAPRLGRRALGRDQARDCRRLRQLPRQRRARSACARHTRRPTCAA